MNQEEIKKTLINHGKWCRGETGGNRANLSGANLSSAYLSGANLSAANLSGANLSSANLSSANLRNADLRSANLSSANLSSANLSSANLRNADLRSADLSSADLRSADLTGANLTGANLTGANLSSADLSSADLSCAKNFAFSILPQGTLIVWKKARDNRIVCLELSPNTKRISTPIGRKCRAESALVISIQSIDGKIDYSEAYSQYDSEFRFVVGQTVIPTNGFNDDCRIECAPGIHFYITREEAVAH